MKMTLFFNFLVCFLIIEIAFSLSTEDQLEILRLHNNERSLYGLGDLVWDDDLANESKRYAERCEWKHSSMKGYGENLSIGWPFLSAKSAVMLWVIEKEDLLPNKGCVEGKVCGHYYQMIKEKNKSIGCGLNVCPGSKYFYVCRYKKQHKTPNKRRRRRRRRRRKRGL